METEVFKPIPYFSDYLIGNKGSIKSTKGKRHILLKPATTTKGYKRAILHGFTGPEAFMVHRLVAMAFLDLSIDAVSTRVGHLNGDRSDNSVENLYLKA